ncbi:MAG: sulfite exporter TauE/SafE family protein [Deferribacterales bacterium]
MENIWVQLLILFASGFIAGILNTLAGGGSFLTIPILIFTGLEPTVANATNRLGIWIQSIFGLGKFRRMGYFPVKMSLMSVIPSLIGSVMGAYLATIVAEDAFKKYLAFFMVLMTLVTFFKPQSDKQLTDFTFTAKSGVTASVVYFFVGLYGGFIQAGVGFVVLAYCVLYGLDYVRGNAVKMFINLLTATLSLAIFIYADKVVYLPGIALGAGMAVGAVMAAGFSVKAGNKFLKRFVSVAVIAFAVLLLFK